MKKYVVFIVVEKKDEGEFTLFGQEIAVDKFDSLDQAVEISTLLLRFYRARKRLEMAVSDLKGIFKEENS